MKNLRNILSTPIFILLIVSMGVQILISCSGGGGGNNGGGNTYTKAKITGVSQKGPFVEGSKATLWELDDTFTQTGRSYFDIIADNKGSFEIKNVELASPYALLEANGFYRNEVTGSVSAAPITLFAIADIREKDNVNVNLLTHLEYYRVLNLVEGGKTVAEAKKQAQKEILAVFGIDSDGFKNSEDMNIFGTSESDGALLAISVLLQGNLREGDFSQRLTNFAQGIKETGVWDNDSVKTAMAYWGLQNFQFIDVIRYRILEWELSSEVPEFGNYIHDYINDYWNYLIKDCSGNQDCLSFVDERDGKTYKSVKIGEQTWMRENLNYATNDSKCLDNKSENCEKLGRIYDLDDAMIACPNGWHLPNNEEWETLIDFVGGEEVAGMNLKAKIGWEVTRDSIHNGVDSYDFTALPYSINSTNGYFLSAKEDDDVYNVMYIRLKSAHILKSIRYNFFNQSYVRCLKN